MSTYIYKTGQQITFEIFVGTSGLTSGDFTSFLFSDGVVAAESVSISEVGSSGLYSISFTPTSIADYVLWAWKTSKPGIKFSENFPVREEFSDTVEPPAPPIYEPGPVYIGQNDIPVVQKPAKPKKKKRPVKHVSKLPTTTLVIHPKLHHVYLTENIQVLMPVFKIPIRPVSLGHQFDYNWSEEDMVQMALLMDDL